MEKTGTVLSISANGTWESKYGHTMYKYAVEMDNGDQGEYSSSKYTSETDPLFPFKVGTQVPYEFTAHEKFPRIAPPKKEWTGNGKGGYSGKSKGFGSLTGFAASYTKDLIVGGVIKLDDLEVVADRFYKWMSEKDSVTPAPEPTPEPTPEPEKKKSSVTPPPVDKIPFEEIPAEEVKDDSEKEEDIEAQANALKEADSTTQLKDIYEDIKQNAPDGGYTEEEKKTLQTIANEKFVELKNEGNII